MQAKAAAQVPVKPKGAAETGDLTEAPGNRTPALVIGGSAVLLGAAGLGAWAYRRRRRA